MSSGSSSVNRNGSRRRTRIRRNTWMKFSPPTTASYRRVLTTTSITRQKCRERATNTIDVEHKSRVSVSDEAMTILRDAFLTAMRLSTAQWRLPEIVVSLKVPPTAAQIETRRPTAAAAAAAPLARGRANPTGWARVPANAGRGIEGRFARGTTRFVTDCVKSRDLRNPSGIEMTSRRITDVGKAVGKILRHHRTLQVNPLGFAWLADVQQRVYDDERWQPT